MLGPGCIQNPKHTFWVMQSRLAPTANFVDLSPINGEPIIVNRSKLFSVMKRVIGISEILGTTATLDGTCEVCASADANYDDSAGRLIVRLDSFLRTTNLQAGEKRVPAKWLPKRKTVTETIAFDETAEAARNISITGFGKCARKRPHCTARNFNRFPLADMA